MHCGHDTCVCDAEDHADMQQDLTGQDDTCGCDHDRHDHDDQAYVQLTAATGTRASHC